MIATTAVDEVIDALAVALDVGAIAVDGYVGVFHEGQVVLPPQADPDVAQRYVVVAGAAEPEEERGLTQPGREQVVQVRCWSSTWYEAGEVYRAVMGALNGVPLALATHRMVRARLARVTDYPDPDPNVTAHVVVAEYRTRTVPA